MRPRRRPGRPTASAGRRKPALAAVGISARAGVDFKGWRENAGRAACAGRPRGAVAGRGKTKKVRALLAAPSVVLVGGRSLPAQAVGRVGPGASPSVSWTPPTRRFCPPSPDRHGAGGGGKPGSAGRKPRRQARQDGPPGRCRFCLLPRIDGGREPPASPRLPAPCSCPLLVRLHPGPYLALRLNSSFLPFSSTVIRVVSLRDSMVMVSRFSLPPNLMSTSSLLPSTL